VGAPEVNVVNALHLAKQRGIHVERTRVDAPRDHADLIELRVSTSSGAIRVEGALLGAGHPRIVRIDDFRVDVVPRGMLMVLRNRDVPGVIGRVGTLLGNAGINIAEYHQARVAAGGDALAAISVDARLPGQVLDALRALPEVRSASLVDFGPSA
jgi:D-3-phosphoglycerate dehydrogenase